MLRFGKDHTLHVGGPKYNLWHLQVWLGQAPCLKPCRAAASQGLIQCKADSYIPKSWSPATNPEGTMSDAAAVTGNSHIFLESVPQI